MIHGLSTTGIVGPIRNRWSIPTLTVRGKSNNASIQLGPTITPRLDFRDTNTSSGVGSRNFIQVSFDSLYLRGSNQIIFQGNGGSQLGYWTGPTLRIGNGSAAIQSHDSNFLICPRDSDSSAWTMTTRGSDRSGILNGVGGDCIVSGGAGTGTGNGGNLLLKVALPTTSSSTSNTYSTVLTISGTNGGSTFTSLTATTVPLTITGAASQSGAYLQCLESDSTLRTWISSVAVTNSVAGCIRNGSLSATYGWNATDWLSLTGGNGTLLYHQLVWGANNSVLNSRLKLDGSILLTPTDTTVVPVVVNGIASQTANYINITSSGGSAGDLLSVTSAGILTAVQVNAVGDFRAGATGSIYWNTRSAMSSPSNGLVRVGNLAGTNYVTIGHDGTDAIIDTSSGALNLTSSGTGLINIQYFGSNRVQVANTSVSFLSSGNYPVFFDQSANIIGLASGYIQKWSSSATNGVSSFDLGIGRNAAGVLEINSGTAGTLRDLTLRHITFTDGGNIVIGSTTGTTIGTASTQKLGVWGATPVVQNTGWSVTGGYSSDKAFDPESTSALEIGRVLGTLIDTLKSYGLLGA